MAKGRIPKPAVLNQLKGDPHKRRRHKVEPSPPSDHPQCPEHLGKIAQTEWTSVTEQLEKMDLLSSADKTALEQYCHAYQQWREAIELQNKAGGPLMKTPNGHVQPGPWVSMIRQWGDVCRKYLIEFGLTPAARARMAVPKDAGKKGTSLLIPFVQKNIA